MEEDHQMSASSPTNPYQAPQADVGFSGSSASMELATRGSRLAAVLLDGLFGLAFMLPGLLMAVLGMESSQQGNPSPMMIAGWGLLAAGVIILIVIQLRLVSANGWTLGKRTCGVRMVRVDGSPMGVGRYVGLRVLVPAAIGGIPIVGAIFSLADPLFIFGQEQRCLHDRIADTIVVRA